MITIEYYMHKYSQIVLDFKFKPCMNPQGYSLLLYIKSKLHSSPSPFPSCLFLSLPPPATHVPVSRKKVADEDDDLRELAAWAKS